VPVDRCSACFFNSPPLQRKLCRFLSEPFALLLGVQTRPYSVVRPKRHCLATFSVPASSWPRKHSSNDNKDTPVTSAAQPLTATSSTRAVSHARYRFKGHPKRDTATTRQTLKIQK